MKEIVIFYHIFLENDWKKILIEQVNKLIEFKLDLVSDIKIGVVYSRFSEEDQSDLISILNKLNNFEIILNSPNNSIGEGQTIKKIKEFCDKLTSKLKIFYFHTKGISQQHSVREIPVNEWRKMMEFFLLEKWENCTQKLDEGYDCCGVNYQNHAGNINGEIKLIKIFNGNFFWTNSDYIKKIDKNFLFETRYSAENWILSVDHNVYSFFDTPLSVNLYYDIIKDYKN